MKKALKTSLLIIYFLTSHSQPSYAQPKARDQLTNWNPIKASGLDTIGGIVNAFAPYAFIIAGLALLLMIISGGFSLLTSAGNPESAEKGKQRLGAAFMGFIIIFAAYWIIQILQVILGINILTG